MADPTPNATHTDYLGYGAYADSLWARIQAALNKDVGKDTLGDDPLVVGIFGEWGAGKSYLLKLIHEQAKQQSTFDIATRSFETAGDVPLTITIPVFFQPWKYEHEAHLHVPLAVHISDAVDDAWKNLPAGWEVVDKLLKDGKIKIEDAAEKIEKAKGVFDKLKSTWEGAETAIKSPFMAMIAAALDALLMTASAPPLASVGLQKIKNNLPVDGDEASKKAEENKSKSAIAASKPASITTSDKIGWKDDGLSFYRTDKLLQALTRPTKNKKFLANMGAKIGAEIEYDLRLNFVVFVDDLDRCLPEKAVQTLELIKTVFNTESFAFVLALDEEVIERGIGHRYQAYNFAGKKPEMPITGFEYLEKIVHIPFRLPALTNHQARQFVRHYEQTLEANAGKRWFDAPSIAQDDGSSHGMRLRGKNSNDSDPRKQMDLLPIALACFDHYVPRKLIRMVELTHQIAQVAEVRGNPIPREYGQANQAIDPRVVLAMLLLQLFQPDIYRFMRRHGQAFGTLLAAFEMDEKTNKSDLPHGAISNAHLCRWVLGGLWENGQDTPWTKVGAGTGRGSAREELMHGLEQAISAKLLQDDLGQSKKAKDSESALAQQIRLPLTGLLLEHRDVQRHAFDPLKLFQILAKSLQHSGLPSLAIKFRPYLSLLADKPERGVSSSMKSNSASEDTHLVYDVPSLLDDLLSGNPNIRANVLDLNDIPDGAYLADQTVEELIGLLNARLREPAVESGEIVGYTDSDENTATHDRPRFFNSLGHLAPAIAPRHGAEFWSFVQNIQRLPNHQPNAVTENPKAVSDYLDLRSMLRCDDRFDADNFNLYSPPHEDERSANPLTHFVKFNAGTYKLGSEQDRSDNAPSDYVVAADFYLAPCLTTVDQYALFVDSKDYADAKWWGAQGVQWLSGAWDETFKKQDADLPSWLAERSIEQRKRPMRWSAQLRVGARPVHSLTWFEARAYTRWLTAQLQVKNSKWLNIDGKAYECTLPTEVNWEVAARMQQDGTLHGRPWMWEDESEAGVSKRANTHGSGIEHSSIAGCFSPTEMGLFDMAGNVWEWQNNLYQIAGDSDSKDRLQTLNSRLASESMTVTADWGKSDHVALRGGSWVGNPEYARCSCRGGAHPDGWDDYVGFRVMLSLAN